MREDGTRTVFFELNGQPREVSVVDRSVEGTVKRHPKADPDNPNHVGGADARQGVVGGGQASARRCKAGERLLSIEAMKMETAVYAPSDATVSRVEVAAGAVVEAGDLLVALG